jgi:DNA-binding NarL/FixJ family response regulator
VGVHIPPATPTILLVEDNPRDVYLFREMLAGEASQPGFAFETATTLKAALERLHRPGLAAVVLDLGLPDCTGLEGVYAMASLHPDVPIVVLTGLDDEATGLRAIGAGAQDYLVKGKVDGPSLERSLRYSIGRKSEQRRGVLAALDRFPVGILFIGQGGRVFMANSVAEEILAERDGLRIEQGYLVADHPQLTRELQSRLTGAAGPSYVDGELGLEAMAFPRRSGRRPLTLLITSAQGGVRDQTRPWTVLFLTDPERRTGGNASVLVSLYGLSQAEARLACSLMEGKSLRETADERGVTIHTVRTQLKSILDKTNTSRQGELVRLLLAGPTAIRLYARGSWRSTPSMNPKLYH